MYFIYFSNMKLIRRSSSTNQVAIVDARPYQYALANRAKGGGFESADTYNCELKFLDIDNIHAMRDALDKLRKVVEKSDQSKFMSKLETTNWMFYLHQILKGSIYIADKLQRGTSVLVHCR